MKNCALTFHRARLLFAGLFVLLVGVEFLIGIFAHDEFIRPFVGDVIVVIVLYSLARVFVPQKWYGLSAAVFLFAVLGQYRTIQVCGLRRQIFRQIV